jgi:hypothetical protein
MRGGCPETGSEGWVGVDTDELSEQANQAGGLIGVTDLVDCVRYDTPESFPVDSAAHQNPAAWFRPPRLFGFRFVNPRPLQFVPYKGNTFFFKVEGIDLS